MKIDVAMIVRDAEPHLADCVASIQGLEPFLGEVCVFDTGSVDRTVAMARDLGCRVVEGAWEDSFAAARNSALAMCTASWAMCIDADERLVTDPVALARFLEAEERCDVVDATFTHLDEAGRVIGSSRYEKVLRVGAVEFHGRVHETLARMDGGEIRSASAPPEILHFRHTGYATPHLRRAKAQRNAALSELEVVDALAGGDGDRVGQARYHHARALQGIGQTDRALGELHAAMGAFRPGSTGRHRVVHALVPLLLDANDVPAAAEVVRAHAVQGGSPHHVRLLTARIALHQAHPERALAVLAGIPESGDPHNEVEPQELLRMKSEALDALGRADDALACCFVAVARWADLARVPELLVRTDGQDRRVLARLLVESAAPPVDAAALCSALHAAGQRGRAVAEALVEIVGEDGLR